MEYAAYKLQFTGSVHFGQRTLESASMTFGADRLFSAIALEAAAEGEGALSELVSLVEDGKLRLSDAFPYADEEYFCIKPMMRPPRKNAEEDIAKRKIFKKLEYLPFSRFASYLEGMAAPEELESPPFGTFSVKTSVAVYPGIDPKPYRVGVFSFRPNCGLYVLVGYDGKGTLGIAEDLLDRLSFVGIGGKRSAGLGRFELHRGKFPEEGLRRLKGMYKTYMTLAAALPTDDELPAALEGAHYLLEKKSGFVASPDYAPEWRRKRDSYAFKTGSCFQAKFSGQLKDVSNGGKHPVYRYLQPLFMGVE